MIMTAILKDSGALFFLLLLHAAYPAKAQEASFQIRVAMALPQGLTMDNSSGCWLESQEQWIIDPARSSITKRVDAYEFPCQDTVERVKLPEGTRRLKNVSYEFTFLDLPEELAKEVQEAINALISERFPIPGTYDPSEQLLSIYFHEDWLIEPGPNQFSKKVQGITPVIWQRRQRADGEPVLDPDTGYPVFYKLSLERIDLRQP